MNPPRSEHLELVPIGVVEESGTESVLQVFPPYRKGLEGAEGFSHLWLFYWFHENDNPAGRSVLQVHPRKDPSNPLTGVFGTRSPLRPNLIGMCLCEVLEIRASAGRIRVRSLDARAGSPLLDIKPYLPHRDRPERVRLPEWATRMSGVPGGTGAPGDGSGR